MGHGVQASALRRLILSHWHACKPSAKLTRLSSLRPQFVPPYLPTLCRRRSRSSVLWAWSSCPACCATTQPGASPLARRWPTPGLTACAQLRKLGRAPPCWRRSGCGRRCSCGQARRLGQAAAQQRQLRLSWHRQTVPAGAAVAAARPPPPLQRKATC